MNIKIIIFIATGMKLLVYYNKITTIYFKEIYNITY